ncbi:MAG: hypothetical protein IJ464_01455 [Alistipes sp.]|nr:hypothetical protein [Alistipes sp.]
MFKNISYFWLALSLLVVQIFILDQLSIAMWLRPMLFPLIVILLPMEWRTIWVLMVSLIVGVVLDVSLGGAGLYTATLLPLAVVRSTVMYLTTHRSVEHGDQTALLSRMALRQLMIYVGAMLLLHHALFFWLEAMSVALLWQLLATILFSTLLSLIIAWPIVRLFISKIVR